jgi:hypothetical protein
MAPACGHKTNHPNTDPTSGHSTTTTHSARQFITTLTYWPKPGYNMPTQCATTLTQRPSIHVQQYMHKTNHPNTDPTSWHTQCSNSSSSSPLSADSAIQPLYTATQHPRPQPWYNATSQHAQDKPPQHRSNILTPTQCSNSSSSSPLSTDSAIQPLYTATQHPNLFSSTSTSHSVRTLLSQWSKITYISAYSITDLWNSRSPKSKCEFEMSLHSNNDWND